MSNDPSLTAEGRTEIDRLARQHQVQPQSVEALARAIDAGGGRQAQFSIPELGGMGQWSSGGMVMVGDTFNHALKAKLASLATALSAAAAKSSLFERAASAASGEGWPAELGEPSSTGSQNGARYAFFPKTQRLAIERAGKMTVYDTKDHVIGGVAQQQGASEAMRFTSQYGLIDLSGLDVVAGGEAAVAPAGASKAEPSDHQHDAVFAKIEKLGALRDKGLVTDEEFAAKKAELLRRL